jgi:hypothetical protein
MKIFVILRNEESLIEQIVSFLRQDDNATLYLANLSSRKQVPAE